MLEEKVEVAEPEVEVVEEEGFEVGTEEAKELVKQQLAERFGINDEKLLELALKLYKEKKKEELDITKQALGILPEVAKADNPAIIHALNLLVGRKSESREDDLLKTFKEIQLLSTLPAIQTAMVKKVLEGMNVGSSDKLILQYFIERAEESEKRFQELLTKIIEEKNEQKLEELRKEVREVVAEMVNTTNAVLDKIEMIMESMNSRREPVEGVKKDPLEELAEMKERISTLMDILKELGFDIKLPGSLDPYELKLKEAEVQAKLKEIELREKEIMAKQEFLRAVGEGIKNILSNPDALVNLLRGLGGILRPTKQAAVAMQKVIAKETQEPQIQIPEPEPSLPDLDLENILEEVKGSGGQGSDESS